MITRQMVTNTLEHWINAGIRPPYRNPSMMTKMRDDFFMRFHTMDSETLKYVTDKLSLSTVWPTFSVISQVAHEFKEQQNQYVYIDYYRELEQQAYEPDEDFEGFVARIAKKYFPGKEAEWLNRHAFTLHFYGIRMQACKNCQGNCPHNGHQYALRMERGTDKLLPWASLDICPRYKQTVDNDGVVYRNLQEVEWTSATDEKLAVPDDEPTMEQFTSSTQFKKINKEVKVEVPTLFGEEEINNANTGTPS